MNLNYTRQIFKKNILFVIYLTMLMGICLGVYYDSGFTYYTQLIVYTIALAFGYYLAQVLVPSKFFTNKIKIPTKYNLILWYILLISSLSICLVHFLLLGYIPALEIYKSLSSTEISFIREDILTKLNPIFVYCIAFNLNAALPFILYHARKTKQKYFPLVYFFVFIYVLNIMQKSYLLFVILPLVIFLIKNKYYKQGLLVTIISAASIFFIIWLSNPFLRATSKDFEVYNQKYIQTQSSLGKQIVPQSKPITHAPQSTGVIASICIGFYNRLALVPGQVVSKWFYYIPDTLPYTNGYNIRPIAKISGKDYQDYNYARKIYDLEFPLDAKNGLKGTANVAHFMNDYASFGYWGLIFAAFQIVIILQIIQLIFKNNFVELIAFNIIFLLALSSTALTTTLFSGGWALMICFYLLFNSSNENSN